MNKFNIALFAICFWLTASPSQAEDLLVTAMGFGAGIGSGSISGDYMKSSTGLALGGGLDFDGNLFMLKAGGHTTVDNDSKSMDIALGMGNKWIKVGLAYAMIGADVATSNTPVAVGGGPLVGIVNTDTSRDTSLQVDAFSPFVRLSPIRTKDSLVSMDFYYSLASSGEQKVPVRVLGLDGYLVTEPVKAGGAYGISLQAVHRIKGSWAVFGRYGYDRAQLNGGNARVQGDILGSYNSVPIPDVSLRNQVFMIGVMMVH